MNLEFQLLEKSQFVQTLRSIADLVEAGHSVEGMIEYTTPSIEHKETEDMLSVRGMWKVPGNGVQVIGKATK